MRVHLITVAYLSLTQATVRSVLDCGLDVDFSIYTHSSDPRMLSVALSAATNDEVVLVDHRRNRGLSKSWNDGLLISRAEEYATTIIFGDDCVFSHGDIKLIVETAVANPQTHMVVCGGYNKAAKSTVPNHAYSCFAITPAAIEKIGAFDQNFFPAYYEDNDYDRRAKLLEFTRVELPQTGVIHEGSGSLFKAGPELARQHSITFPACGAYYIRKWGGGPAIEKYEYPFNDPSVSLRIPFENVDSPYGPMRDVDWGDKSSYV